MDKAKAAVGSILSKAGHHDTTVHENVAPHVQKETVNEQRREEQQVVKDREVHQDHYHTTVQPIKDQEVLPEQHHHKQVGVEHRTHDHRDHAQTQQHLQKEKAQFQHESTRVGAQHTQSQAVPEVAGEHVHHHVHETIQPVVHKQTIEPHVVHTTVPVHEKHFNAPQHHTASALPAVNMSEFKQQGGALHGRDETVDQFKGNPSHLDKHIGSGHNAQSGGLTNQHGNHTAHQQQTGGLTGQHGTHSHHQQTGGLTDQQGINPDHQTGGGHTDLGSHHTPGDGRLGEVEQHSKTGKPSLMDKLNPMKDADGDGKKGFMK